MTVLPESAAIPSRNVIQPPPNQFTHEVRTEQPYYYVGSQQAAPPEGTFPAGTKVILLSRTESECYVADARGLYVATACKGLRRIQESRRK